MQSISVNFKFEYKRKLQIRQKSLIWFISIKEIQCCVCACFCIKVHHINNSIYSILRVYKFNANFTNSILHFSCTRTKLHFKHYVLMYCARHVCVRIYYYLCSRGETKRAPHLVGICEQKGTKWLYIFCTHTHTPFQFQSSTIAIIKSTKCN